MEQAMLWVTVAGMIIIPFIAWLLNTLITKKIDALEEGREKDKKLFFDKLDSLREDLQNEIEKNKKIVEENYVLQKMYDQAMQFHQKETDSKFNNLVESMNKQFDNVEKNIDDVKKLINDKFNGHKQ